MFSGLLNLSAPALAAAGAIAIASPIIIHLLSKRRFRIVDWAAMDFLLEANRRNRRRILLENLLLLFMRCLALILLGLLLARPYTGREMMAMWGLEAASVDRIVLLDDSPSMDVRTGRENKTALDTAKESLIQFVQQAAVEKSNDRFTLLLTSDPKRPLVNGELVAEGDVGDIVERIEGVRATALSADLGQSLSEVKELLASRQGSNYALYVVTDMRDRDWQPPQEAEAEKTVAGILKSIAEGGESTAVSVLDVGSDAADNVIVTEIKPVNKTLVAGVESHFQVIVKNAGPDPVDGIEVELRAGDAVTLKEKVQTLAAGQSRPVDFRFAFAEPGSVRVQATVIGADLLPVDNDRYYAARVRQGRRVLVVDGDPSSDPDKSETRYLQAALNAGGDVEWENLVEVVSEHNFETTELDSYDVIFLCNLYRVSEERVGALRPWVEAGGGLFVSLGEQIDPEVYNRILYDDGKGLLPVKLESKRGFVNKEEWVQLQIDQPLHPSVNVFEGGDAKKQLGAIKFHMWWGGIVTEDEQRGPPDDVTLVAHFTDTERSPAIVEKTVGDGRVLVWTTTVDKEWTNMPGLATNLYFTQDLAIYMSPRTSDQGNAQVGMPLRQSLDPATYLAEVEIVDPNQQSKTVEAVLEDDAQVLAVEHDDTRRQGFYELRLTRLDELKENVLFATNLNPTEGELKRVDQRELRTRFGDARITLTAGMGELGGEGDGNWSQLWVQVLALVVVVLCAEQLMAWAFGRRR